MFEDTKRAIEQCNRQQKRDKKTNNCWQDMQKTMQWQDESNKNTNNGWQDTIRKIKD